MIAAAERYFWVRSGGVVLPLAIAHDRMVDKRLDLSCKSSYYEKQSKYSKYMYIDKINKNEGQWDRLGGSWTVCHLK